MTISVTESLKLVDQRELYDALCIQLFSYNWVLSYLIKYTLLDYSHLSIEEIYRCLSDKQVGDYPFHQTRIHNENTVDKHVEDGNRYFDILFSVRLRNKEGIREKVYINVEMQNNYYPGYSLITRGEYYASRLITRQQGREFKGESFDSLKKVYSIWICTHPSKKDDNTITRYPIVERNMVGVRKVVLGQEKVPVKLRISLIGIRLSLFFIVFFFIIIGTLIIAVTMYSYGIVKCFNIFIYAPICLVIIPKPFVL